MEASSKEIDQEHGEGGKERRGKPHRERGEALPEKRRKSNGPEKEGRLVRVHLSVAVHQNPVPALNNLSCDLAVAGFIGIPEIPLVQVYEEENDAEGDQDRDLPPVLG